MRADHVMWIATSNTIATLPATVVDRCVVVTIGRPSLAEGRRIAEELFAKFLRDRPGITPRLPAGAFELLAHQSPRTMRKSLHFACGFAAGRDSSAISVDDIKAALDIAVTPTEARSKIGFI
ncbi:hypothetical protein CCR94_07195 [Rhodoblastus sphagnicola]|uniref:ATPase AAA-type core domain-containing protein n=1 Tax=Rhodoblastus sphagnicola TaxID=333368 RepID=A0A2S6NBK8_9HYPH|nr:hypothetical protein [Rhodoblastus sphagnicola]MBB4199640.1 hypothetical protein [Rhodoblastus sphagnicola]PPQ31987.1 hypothetical protein CCR94_07195 [Rhodoblastus sphagnicola]